MGASVCSSELGSKEGSSDSHALVWRNLQVLLDAHGVRYEYLFVLLEKSGVSAHEPGLINCFCGHACEEKPSQKYDIIMRVNSRSGGGGREFEHFAPED